MSMQYATRDGQNIFDIVTTTVGDLGKTIAFIQANPYVESIDFDFQEAPNLVLQYTPSEPVRPSEVTNKITVEEKTSYIIGRFGQSIFDICLMTTNNFGSIIQNILIPNNVVNLASNAYGVRFDFNKADIKDVGIYNHIYKKATAISSLDIVNYLTEIILQAPSGLFRKLIVNDDGEVSSESSVSGDLTEILLQSVSGLYWEITVNNDGEVYTKPSAPGDLTEIILQAPGGLYRKLTVNDDGEVSTDPYIF